LKNGTGQKGGGAAAASTRLSASGAEAMLLELAQDRGRSGLQIFGLLSNSAAVLHGLEGDLALTRIVCRGQVGVMKSSASLSSGRPTVLFHYCNSKENDFNFKPRMGVFGDHFGGFG